MRTLEFVPPAEKAFVDAIGSALRGGAKRLQIQETGPLATQVTHRLRAQFPDVVIETAPSSDPAPIVVLFETDGEKLTAALMEQMDRPSVHVIAPVTDWIWNRRSLFLISIPKSGTHLLMELAAAFGYRSGEEAPPEAVPGAWHYLEFTNSHTAAPDFFIDTVRRAPHGNRAHSFPRTPSLFIYRNPLDIVASEANYYQEDGATVFAGYLDGLSYEERLLRLIDDPWLMGSIRDRVGKFSAWLEVGSVIPVSFEELVGPQGGGDAKVQADLIWSLMLRLQVPGKPSDIAARVFNPNSPTFRFGKIGGHEKRFNEAAWARFRALSPDFMRVYGFGQRPASGAWLPSRADEFRRRVPRYSKIDMGATPFLVRQNYLGHNILRYRGRFWAMPHGFPFGDLLKAPPEAFKMMLSADDPATLEFLVQSKLILNYNRNTA